MLDNITVNVYLAPAELQSTLDNIVNHLKEIIMDQTQLAAELVALKTQNDKARAEVLAKLATLEAAIAAAGNTTAEVDAALADLKASVQTDDDIVPDDVVAP